MNDDERKTIRRIPDATLFASTPPPPEEPAPTPPVEPAAAPHEKEPFDPFKFQSITMPDGLRAEIIEEARNRPPERVPEDTLPPNNGVALSNPPRDDAPTLRITSDNAATLRLPRVLLARAQRRDRRIAAVVLPLVLVAGIGAIVWSRQQQEFAPSVTPVDNVNVATPAAAEARPLPVALPSEADFVAPPPPTATASSSAAPTLPEPAPTHDVRRQRAAPNAARGSSVPKAPSPSTQSLSPNSNAEKKPTSSQPKGDDLLDFAGPAPK